MPRPRVANAMRSLCLIKVRFTDRASVSDTAFYPEMSLGWEPGQGMGRRL